MRKTTFGSQGIVLKMLLPWQMLCFFHSFYPFPQLLSGKQQISFPPPIFLLPMMSKISIVTKLPMYAVCIVSLYIVYPCVPALQLFIAFPCIDKEYQPEQQGADKETRSDRTGISHNWLRTFF